jgi:hypothetical protein
VTIDGIYSELCSIIVLFTSEEDIALKTICALRKELGRAEAVNTRKVEITAGTNNVAISGTDQFVRKSRIHELARLGVDIEERDTAAINSAFVGRRNILTGEMCE